MLFAEEQARWLLVAHTAVAAAVVGAATHLVVWLRPFVRGQFERLRGARKLAAISAGLYVVTLILGNLVYPVYKVRVRVEYLERPAAVVAEQQQRAEIAAQARAEHDAALGHDEGALGHAGVAPGAYEASRGAQPRGLGRARGTRYNASRESSRPGNRSPEAQRP